ncbi:MAG TPA: hypothetical protein PLO89_00790 [Spirochaetota bacterium]|nr:hypothetical protein [Spirochaetota bacterium]
MNKNFGKLKEKKLHSEIKKYISGDTTLHEKEVEGFLIDVVKDQTLFEVQTGNFSNIKNKLDVLLKNHKVRLVYNIPALKIIKNLDAKGDVVSVRKSPKKGKICDAAKELIYIADIVTRDNFSFEIIFTKEEEVRIDDQKGSWRRKGLSVKERNLLEVIDNKLFLAKNDYIELLPEKFRNPEITFSSSDIKNELKRTASLSRKIIYFLKKINLIEKADKNGNLIIYRIVSSPVKV